MARIGLGAGWRCEFANDISPMKTAAYLNNFPDSNYRIAPCDINKVNVDDIPGHPDLIWGSFPCQDLSLAGEGRGLDGARSGLIWRLLEIGRKLEWQGRGAGLLVLENVTGLLNSRGGQDFYDILSALADGGYHFGTLVIDAIHFLPQSRPRIFLVALDVKQIPIQPGFIADRLAGDYMWTSPRLDSLWRNAPPTLRKKWIWWNLPTPPKRTIFLEDIIQTDVESWDAQEYTDNLLQLMTALHRDKVRKASALKHEVIGTLYRRTRVIDGVRGQRVEVRFDGVSGCLRTPSGGSSRQRLLVVRGRSVRSRLLSVREAARLMGIPDTYQLPSSYNEAYQLVGDGVAVPVVRWLSEQLLLPILLQCSPGTQKEARYVHA